MDELEKIVEEPADNSVEAQDTGCEATDAGGRRSESEGRRRHGSDSDGADTTDDARHDGTNEDCQRTCRRHFWTELLRSVTKIAGIVLAAFGLSSFTEDS